MRNISEVCRRLLVAASTSSLRSPAKHVSREGAGERGQSGRALIIPLQAS